MARHMSEWKHRELMLQYNREDHMTMQHVTRYVPTYVKADGMRTLMRAAQGRDTFATEAEAQAWIDAVTSNNSADTIQQVWGGNPQFAVRSCPCYPGHFDPQTVWFD